MDVLVSIPGELSLPREDKELKLPAKKSAVKKRKKRTAVQTLTVMAVDHTGDSTLLQCTRQAIMKRTGRPVSTL